MNNDAGLAFHCHHALMIEYCHSFDEREYYIKTSKPQDEREVRLKCFKFFTAEMYTDLPPLVREMYETYKKEREEYLKIRKLYDNDTSDDGLTYHSYKYQLGASAVRLAPFRQKMDNVMERSSPLWPHEAREAFHKKWCGCTEWDGDKGEIVFPEIEEDAVR